MAFLVILAIFLPFLLPRRCLHPVLPYFILFHFVLLPGLLRLKPYNKDQSIFINMAESADKPTHNNRGFYLAIAFGIMGLFLMMVIPCAIAMGIARCREKRQERRDALRRELEEGQGDEATCIDAADGRFPVFCVDEVGESSGWRRDENDLETTTNLYQDTTILQHADGLVEVRKPEPAYGPGTCRFHGGRFQEHLPEAFEQFPEQPEVQMLEQPELNEDSAEDSASASSYKGKGKEPLIVKRKEE
ncbi:hypothetical protein BBK36DRAFT_1097 [Trichoderma citrinoviride]|uniref:Uncharacterized protein n=1 Tax=Trichoderma citrinoviride TaxID=58853 RepID=A0A2T4BJF0_9HYPO|nr:hypothetical protein BBK36DRAFT_1097 [Trichoderma citrinoviride]PTB69433.1 hypothetical protein BBK36DRAFT_1097 [Trichoderma citrinoviride]